MRDFHSQLKKLAKDNYWQTLYSQAKEVHGVTLFDNQTDFSNIQMMFLNYLGYYNALHTDIYLGEVNELVLKDEIYEEAYVYYKNQSRKKKTVETTKDRPLPSAGIVKNHGIQQGSQTSFVFKRKNK